MNEVTAEELANETVDVIDRATHGESMVVTDGGRPIALLLPPPGEHEAAVSDPRSDLTGLTRPV